MRVGLGAARWRPEGGRGRAGAEPELPRAIVAAVVDALLGAAGLVDAGFDDGGSGRGDPDRVGPEDAPGGAGSEAAEAAHPLERAVRRVEGENYQVVNLDVSVLGGPTAVAALSEEPRRLALDLAERLHTTPGAVSLKVSPAHAVEGAGREGEGGPGFEGGEVFAVVLLDQMRDIDALHASIRGG